MKERKMKEGMVNLAHAQVIELLNKGFVMVEGHRITKEMILISATEIERIDNSDEPALPSLSTILTSEQITTPTPPRDPYDGMGHVKKCDWITSRGVRGCSCSGNRRT